MNERVTDS